MAYCRLGSDISRRVRTRTAPLLWLTVHKTAALPLSYAPKSFAAEGGVEPPISRFRAERLAGLATPQEKVWSRARESHPPRVKAYETFEPLLLHARTMKNFGGW